ncbi:MAG TPA: hypothetical protein PLD30_11775 [Candidatus Competibacteraceae bacterium]|nr:hypothetical protein [Candidatus Competibacteraceae bacterium]
MAYLALALVLGGSPRIQAKGGSVIYIAYVLILTVALITICYSLCSIVKRLFRSPVQLWWTLPLNLAYGYQ